MRVWRAIRQSVYINCWARGEHESHALWKIYCPSSEGVVIKTTLGKLRASVPDNLEVLPVGYSHNTEATGDIWKRMTLKRPMFSYEQEMRAVWYDGSWLKTADENPSGRTIEWDPSLHVDDIIVHPESDDSFLQTVSGTVRAFAPALEALVRSSTMAADPRMAYLPTFQKLAADGKLPILDGEGS